MKRKTRTFLIKLNTQVIYALTLIVLSLSFTELNAQDKANLNILRSAYSISDLEVLQQANAYREFFKHAHDILPTKRSKYWLDMLSNMAQGYIDYSVKQDAYDQDTFQQVEKLARWPELRGDEFYQVKRNRFALNFFKVCLSTQKTSECKKNMLSFWKTATKDAETGYRLLQYFAGFFPRHNNWPLIKDIITKADGKFYCDRPLVADLVFEHLESQHLFNDSSNRIKIYLSQMTTKQCWQRLTIRAKKKMEFSPVSQTRSLFSALENTKMLNPIESKSWLIRYYLSNPSPGKLLNRAWNELEKLSANYDQRKQVLKRLLSLDPLPDHLFTHLKRKKNQTLYFHFVANFPEYIQRYSETCVAYREGKLDFPRGNPTIQCQELMAFDKNLKRKKISQEIHLRYSGTSKGFKSLKP